MGAQGGVRSPDRRIGQPTITVGAGRTNPQGRAVDIAIGDDDPIEAWRVALSSIPPAECAWWSPHVWSRDYALADDWIGAHAAAVDLDYEDPRLGRERHTDVSREAWADLYSMAQDGDLPCNLLHPTPRGARAIVVFDRPSTNRDEMAAAVRGAAETIAAALQRAGIDAHVPRGGGKVRAGFAVDRSCFNLKALFWAPRCTVGGSPRLGEVHVVLREPIEVDELVAAAPPPEVETSPAMGGRGSSDVAEAARQWCDDHPIDFAAQRRECPACGHRGCFGPTPEAPDRWFCFSANHHVDSGGCGQSSRTQPGAYWGDSLDLEAHRRGTTPLTVLRADGYLPEPDLFAGVDIGGMMRKGLAMLMPAGALPQRQEASATPQGGGDAEKRTNARMRFDLLTLDDALALTPPPAIVEGLLREQDLGVLFGAPGCGKSFVSMALALSLASGEDWLGRRVAGPSPVLYIAGEGTYGIGKRVLAWCGGELKQGHPIRQHWRQINDLVPLLHDQAFTGLLDTLGDIAEPERPRLIVVDTLARAMTGGDENSAKDMGLFVLRCAQLRDATGAAILLVHHSGKTAGSGERGSSALRGAADVMMQLERDDTGQVQLTTVKTKDEETPEPIGVYLRKVPLGIDGDGREVSSLRAELAETTAGEDTLGGAPLRILGVLRQQPLGAPWVTFRQIRDALTMPDRTLSRAIKALETAGRVMVRQTGTWKSAALRTDQDPIAAD